MAEPSLLPRLITRNLNRRFPVVMYASMVVQLAGRTEPKGKSMKSVFYADAVCLAFSATPPNATLDVCNLLTVDQVPAASKMKVRPAVPETATDAMIGKCILVHADKGSAQLPVLAFAAYKPKRIKVENDMWTHPQFLKLKPVPGVGDYAYFQEKPRVLYAGIGDNKAVKIQMLDGPSGDARLEILKILAGEALARL
jgi:hypothetical protein